MEEEKKLPKNIRQMAEKEERVRVYLEDYAYTFIHKLNCEGRVRTGVLLGSRAIVENKRCWFVKGAVELEDIPDNEDVEDDLDAESQNVESQSVESQNINSQSINSQNINSQSTSSQSETGQVKGRGPDDSQSKSESETITQQIWNNTQAVIQEYFPECNVCGWFICGSEENFPDGEQLKKTHRQIFSGEDCLMYWKQGDEDSFWMEEDEVILHLKGYFVYYEKNEEMQNYMLSRHEEQSEDVSDQAALNFRKIMKEKQDEKHPIKAIKVAPRTSVWLKTGAAAVFVLLVGGGVLLSRGIQKNEGDSVVALAVGASVERQSGEFEQSSIAGEVVTGEDGRVGEIQSVAQSVGEPQVEVGQTAEQSRAVSESAAESIDDSATQSTSDSQSEALSGTLSESLSESNAQSDSDKKDVATVQENGIFSGDMMFYKDGLGASVYRITDKSSNADSSNTNSSNIASDGNDGQEAKKSAQGEQETNTQNGAPVAGQSANGQISSTSAQEPLTVEIPTLAAGSGDNTTASVEEAAVNRPAAYTVQPGDTLIEISKKFYGSSRMVMQIKEANGLDDINKIYIGQELTLP